MDERSYSWKVHLIRRSGWKNLILFPALFVAGLWGLYLGGVYLLLLAICLLTIALRDFLFPLNYEISPEGVSMRGLLLKGRVRWDEVEEIKREDGVLRLRLSSAPSPRYARWFVIYLTDNEEEIWKRIESWRKNS